MEPIPKPERTPWPDVIVNAATVGLAFYSIKVALAFIAFRVAWWLLISRRFKDPRL